MTGTTLYLRSRQAESWLTVYIADGLSCLLRPVSAKGSRLLVLSFGLAAMVLFSGCERIVGFAKNQSSRESIVVNNANYTSPDDAEPLDLSLPIEIVDSEQQALRAFFKARALFAKSYFSGFEAEAKGNYAQAKTLFEKSIRFYIPDLQAMTLGKNPVHASANWHFFRSLHDYWAKTSVLSGRSSHVERIEENAKDAWALAVIYELTKCSDENGRRKAIAEIFQPVKRGLVSRLNHCEESPIPPRPGSWRMNAEVTYSAPPIGNTKSDVKISESSARHDLDIERIRKSAETRQAEKLNGLESAKNLITPHLLTGDPASGKVYPVRVHD